MVINRVKVDGEEKVRYFTSALARLSLFRHHPLLSGFHSRAVSMQFQCSFSSQKNEKFAFK